MSAPSTDSVRPTYHDVFVTTPDIKRTSIFNLPYGYGLHCTRVTGWQLWFDGGRAIPEPTLVAGEYEGVGKWLVVDVAGHVIVDSRTQNDGSGVPGSDSED